MRPSLALRVSITVRRTAAIDIMPRSADSRLPSRRVAITVRGIVQGVGFRPFVFNTARSMGLAGWVQNEAGMVRIEVQGVTADVDLFVMTLRAATPPQASIDALEISEVPCQNVTCGDFSIRASPAGGVPWPAIPADLAICGACLQETGTPGERRYHYPFTNCTNCGPRWSIIRQLPYDRHRTSMSDFVLCPECEAEYSNPADRRFHAQPIACPRCGPSIAVVDLAGHRLAMGDEAMRSAADAILAGRILALKGLGGFQLLVDATSAAAVSRLRQRKRRPHRPFAVMLGSLEEIRRVCSVDEEEARALSSHQAPIVLLKLRTANRPIAEEVAPGNPYLGVMLPYTPLHQLLMALVRRPIVCTSGNLAEEPMAIHTEDALARLGPIADLFLVHDRPIVRPVDDSVVRVGPEGIQVFRCARGYAPQAIELRASGPSAGGELVTILAVGGHLKNTVALNLGSRVVLSPHVGDLDNLLSVEVHQRAIADLVEFFGVTPEAVACDLHPDYASTRHAEILASRWKVPLVPVQHHHAHVAACVAEHRLDGSVLGLSWDGTGYGPDGIAWGGEFLECQGGEFRRFADLRHVLSSRRRSGGPRAAAIRYGSALRGLRK